MKLKKMLAILSALCLCAVYLPLMEQAIPEVVSITVNAADSGVCGDDLTWTLDDDGTLMISGTGEMMRQMWEYNSDIKNVIIEDGVTSIGNAAFADCTNLKSVSIPGSVITIELQAFVGCYNLTSVTMEEGLEEIGEQAFWYCESLKSISIPESVTSIGTEAFRNTSWLKTKQQENPFVIVNDILIDGQTCTGDITIPDGVTTIGGAAFKENSSITSIVLPDSVTLIEKNAMNTCENLTSITLSENLKEIGWGGISRCRKLKQVILPESLTIIGEEAFLGDRGLTQITIPASVTQIDAWAFESCSSLEEITILNPDCEIWFSESTICNGDSWDPYFDGIIYGYPNSTAQTYAERNGYIFKALDGEPETTESEVIQKGDANGDGDINILDVITINRVVLGKEVLPEAQLKAIDFNGNGSADAEESLMILKYLVGLLTELI